MRKIYVIQEVGDDCESCSFRAADNCRVFNEQLFSRPKPGGTEYLMIERCRSGEKPPLHFKPGDR